MFSKLLKCWSCCKAKSGHRQQVLPLWKYWSMEEESPKYSNDKKTNASLSSIYVIEVNLSTYTSWVFNTGC